MTRPDRPHPPRTGDDRRAAPTPGRLAPPALAFLLATAPLGCGDGGDASGGGAPAGISAVRGQYEPMTEGMPEAMARHIEDLQERFATTDEGGPVQARAAMRNFSDAVAETASAILRSDEIAPELRDFAAQTWLDILRRRLETDRSQAALDRLFEAADWIIERYPNTMLATRAAYIKLDTLGSAPAEVFPDEETRFDRLTALGLEFGRAEPPHPDTAKMLAQFALIAEQRGRTERALALYKVLAERFPNDPFAAPAEANARRLELVGQPLGELKGPGPSGETIDLADYQGKVVLIDFWATWCMPCLEELPALKALYERLGTENFEIIAINVDRDRSMIDEYVKRMNPGWPQIVLAKDRAVPEGGDPLFGVNIDLEAEGAAPESAGAETKPEAESPTSGDPDGPYELERRFGVTALPLKLLIDREGKLVAAGYGLLDVLDDIHGLFPDQDLKIPAPPTDVAPIRTSGTPSAPPGSAPHDHPH